MFITQFHSKSVLVDFRLMTVDLSHRYDTENGTWHMIKSMNRLRRGASAAILNGLIYVLGGYETRYNTSTSVESYDPKTDEWTERMTDGLPDIEVSLVTFNQMLYATFCRGGPGVREYDPVKNVWRKVNEYDHFIDEDLVELCPSNSNLPQICLNSTLPHLGLPTYSIFVGNSNRLITQLRSD